MKITHINEEDRGLTHWQIFTADMIRYAGNEAKPWSWKFLKKLGQNAYTHPGLIAVVVYRYGQWVEHRLRIPILRTLLNLHYYLCYNWVRTRLQIEIPRKANIGPGFRIDHFGGIIFNAQITAGSFLTISSGVLLGQNDKGFPKLLDNVDLGVGAKVIGPITLGNNVRVGAGAVVTKSFSDNAIIAGVPAGLIRFQEKPHIPYMPEEVEIQQERLADLAAEKDLASTARS